jgi:hypothetical protein
MPLPHWQADTTRHPLVLVHLVGADGVQKPDPQSLMRIVEGLIEKRERVVVVYDLTGSKPDATRRRLLVTFLRKHSDSMSRWIVASAIVAPTGFLRGVLVSTFWFIKPKVPVEVFGHRQPALDWAVAQGRRAGLSGLPALEAAQTESPS